MKFLLVFYLFKKIILKTFDENLTPWTETNCVLSQSTNFSPINIDTQKLTCNSDIFLDLIFDQSNKFSQISFYYDEDPSQFNFIPQEGFLNLYIKDKT